MRQAVLERMGEVRALYGSLRRGPLEVDTLVRLMGMVGSVGTHSLLRQDSSDYMRQSQLHGVIWHAVLVFAVGHDRGVAYFKYEVRLRIRSPKSPPLDYNLPFAKNY